MELLNFTRMLRRDWWVILLVLLLTVAGVVGAKSRMVDTYEATSEFGLQFPVRPPTAQDVALNPKLARLRVDNPMLNYDSRGTVTEIVVARLTSGQVASALAAKGVSDYQVDLQPTRVMGGGTLLFSTVATGRTPEQALRGASELRTQAHLVLRQLQGPAAETAYRITLLEVSMPVTATKAMVDQVRVLAAIALLGLLVLLAALSVRAGLRAAREAEAERSRDARLDREPAPTDAAPPAASGRAPGFARGVRRRHEPTGDAAHGADQASEPVT